MSTRTPDSTDVSDDEWEFVAPYVPLLPLDAGQRRYDRREGLNAVRWIVRAGAPWRVLPHALPPWPIV
jgi:transposase